MKIEYLAMAASLTVACTLAQAGEPLLVFTTPDQPLISGGDIATGVSVGTQIGGGAGGVAGGVAAVGAGVILAIKEGRTVHVQSEGLFGCSSDVYKIKDVNIKSAIEPMKWYAITKNEEGDWLIERTSEAQKKQVPTHSCHRLFSAWWPRIQPKDPSQKMEQRY